MTLFEPQALLTESSKMLGLDGQKMPKSYDNISSLREPLEQISKKISTMPTDSARVRLSGPGDPEKCLVWQLHLTYSDQDIKEWATQGCQNTGIGCLECKKPVSDAIKAELELIHKEAEQFENDHDFVRSILLERGEKARESVRETLVEASLAMDLSVWQ